jgi:hypothetical protein
MALERLILIIATGPMLQTEVRYNGLVQAPQTINESYYCLRNKPDGRVSILTTNSYVVGEYDDKTGDIRWQRVVLANQKVVIQSYLHRHFPPKGENTAPAAPVAAAAPAVKDTRKKVAAA